VSVVVAVSDSARAVQRDGRSVSVPMIVAVEVLVSVVVAVPENIRALQCECRAVSVALQRGTVSEEHSVSAE
jgi:hypothetical protein